MDWRLRGRRDRRRLEGELLSEGFDERARLMRRLLEVGERSVEERSKVF